MTTLADLVTQLQSEVPAVNSVPTSTQYEQAIKDAILEFSRLCGLTKRAQLSIVANTAAYALPTDFLKLIWLESLTGADGVILSDAGIIPVSSRWEEDDYTIVNKVITFYPTPTYTLTREIKYKAAWVGTGSPLDYTTLGEDEAQIILLKAKSICLGKQVNAANAGVKYSLGAVSVDKGSGVESKSSKAEKLDDEFKEACDRYNGAILEVS
jgi:hypothetical protein